MVGYIYVGFLFFCYFEGVGTQEVDKTTLKTTYFNIYFEYKKKTIKWNYTCNIILIFVAPWFP